MTDTAIVHLGLQAMLIAFELAAPTLLTALLIGFGISLFQSATQIQEFTLSFVPKVIGAVAVLAIAGPWMLTTLVEYIQRTLQAIPTAVG